MASILLKEKTGYGQSREGEELWECKVFKGELIVPIPEKQRRQIKDVTYNYRLYRDPEVLLHADPVDAVPLEEREIEYIQAIQPTSVRVKEYLNDVDKKMKMGLVVGDKVFFKLKLPESSATKATPTSSVNGTIRYIGHHPDSDGIVFGIEIDAHDQAYRGKGTSNGRPYFTCGPKNAVFVAMDKIIKKRDLSHAKSSQQFPEPSVVIKEQPKPDAKNLSKPVTRSQTKSKSVYDRVKGFVKDFTVFSIEVGTTAEEGGGSSPAHKSRFKEGDRVILQTVKEEVVAGTVRWVGPVRVSKDMAVDPLPVVGIETDRIIDPSLDFEGVSLEVTGSHGTKLFTVAHTHSRVFVPEQLVLFVKEYTTQQQKDNAAKFKQGHKDFRQDDATEEEKRLAAEFGMTVAEYRRQQQRYVDTTKQGKDDRKVHVAGDPEIGEEEEEKYAAGGGMIGGDRGRGEGLNDLTDTIQVMNVGGPEAVHKKRIEEEGRALEKMKLKQQRQHELQHGQREDYQDDNERGRGDNNHQHQPNLPAMAEGMRLQQPHQPQQSPRAQHLHNEGGGTASLPSLHNDDARNQNSPHDDPSHHFDHNRDHHIPGHQDHRNFDHSDPNRNQQGHDYYNCDNQDRNYGQQGYDHDQQGYQDWGPRDPPGHHDHYDSSQHPPDPSHSRDPHQGPPPSLPPDPHHQFTVGSMVRIDTQRGDPLYGVVQWIGTLPDYPGTIAGVELERPLRDCADGTWGGRRFFTCPPGRGYFCPLNTLKQDTRYMDEGQVPAHLRQDIDNPLAKYVSVTEDIDTVGSPDLFHLYIGNAHGIQGHHNSCYLDSTVFGLFALSDSFDVLLLEEPTEEVGRKVKHYLWKGIVNPLRKHGLARYESIMGLRDSLEEFGRMKGAKTDEKDPEEFLNLLFKEVLHIPPFLTIKRPFGVEKEFFIQLFFEIDPNNTEVPKTEKLIAQMFHEQNISFTRVPSKLLLQMPRFGKEFKMYSKIIPSLTLDVKPLMDPSERGDQKCRFCLSGSVSSVCYNCPKELFNTDDPYVYYCSECDKSAHKERKGHCVQNVDIRPGTSDTTNFSKMELLSVICIETSHYVCYTRSGDKWLFHDSMADRLHDMYNVPRVVDVTAGLQDWIYSRTASEDRLMNTPARDIPEYVRRFTQDIYMCVYVNPDLDMYGDNDPEESLSPKH